MPPSWNAANSVLAVAPAAVLLLLAYALAPPSGVIGRTRLAVTRAALVTGAFAVLAVELTAAFGQTTAPVIRSCWVAAVAAAGLAAWSRRQRDHAATPDHGAPPKTGTDTVGRARAQTGERKDGAGTSAGFAGWIRALARLAGDRLCGEWRAAGRVRRVLALAVVALVLGELLMALLAEPNNFDSQTYHLPRIEHWLLAQQVGPYPTAIHRQVTLAPGAEYLLLHLRLLAGGDALYHLPQWAAGVGCLLATSRIAAQFGAGPRAQLITAFLVGTTPMVVMQSTSTQNDLVTAAWTCCVATLVLDGLARPATAGSVLALGTAAGLTAVTKNSGLLAAGPLLVVWAVAQARLAIRSDRPARGAWRAGRVLAAYAGVLVMSAVLVGPFIGRTVAEFGHPLGPPRLRDSIPMQRHDPAAVLVNILRIGHTALDTPLAPVRRGTASVISEVSRFIGVNPQDRKITFGQTVFPVPAWYPDEDRVAFPISGTLALIGVAIALVRPRRLAPAAPRWVLRGYAISLVTAVVLYAATVKWQPWGNRLLLFALVLATPLAGLWIEATLRRAARPAAGPAGVNTDVTARTGSGRTGVKAGVAAHTGSGRTEVRAGVAARTGRGRTEARAGRTEARAGRTEARAGGAAPPEAPLTAPGGPVAVPRSRSAVPAIVAVVLSVAALSALLTLSYGFPRRLVGAGSVLTTDDWNTRFLRRPQWAAEFRWAAQAVDAAGAHRIGLVQQNDNWEYPWWLLLRGREIVALQSVIPHQPPAEPVTVDAVVCTGSRSACRKLLPPDWRMEFRAYVGYALPPPGASGTG